MQIIYDLILSKMYIHLTVAKLYLNTNSVRTVDQYFCSLTHLTQFTCSQISWKHTFFKWQQLWH